MALTSPLDLGNIPNRFVLTVDWDDFLPGLPVAELNRFLDRPETPRHELISEFLAWADRLGIR